LSSSTICSTTLNYPSANYYNWLGLDTDDSFVKENNDPDVVNENGSYYDYSCIFLVINVFSSFLFDAESFLFFCLLSTVLLPAELSLVVFPACKVVACFVF